MADAKQVAAGLSTLAPDTPLKVRKDVKPIVDKIVRQIATHHLGHDLLVHLYCAGVWHGFNLAAKENPDNG